MNRALFLASIASAALVGLLFGFDTAVISGVTADLRNVYSLSPAALGATVSSALITFLFPLVAAQSKAAPFGFFAAMMGLQFFVVLRYFPETKGTKLEDMEVLMRR